MFSNMRRFFNWKKPDVTDEIHHQHAEVVNALEQLQYAQQRFDAAVTEEEIDWAIYGLRYWEKRYRVEMLRYKKLTAEVKRDASIGYSYNGPSSEVF